MKVSDYLINLLLGIDQLGNTILGGDPDETISSRIGRMKLRHGGEIPWRRPLVKIVDWGLDRIEPYHTLNAIESIEIVDICEETTAPLPEDPLPEIPVKPLLRIDEAAGILRCSERSVRRYIRNGKLVRSRPGMVTRASLMQFMGMFGES